MLTKFLKIKIHYSINSKTIFENVKKKIDNYQKKTRIQYYKIEIEIYSIIKISKIFY